MIVVDDVTFTSVHSIPFKETVAIESPKFCPDMVIRPPLVGTLVTPCMEGTPAIKGNDKKEQGDIGERGEGRGERGEGRGERGEGRGERGEGTGDRGQGTGDRGEG